MNLSLCSNQKNLQCNLCVDDDIMLRCDADKNSACF